MQADYLATKIPYNKKEEILIKIGKILQGLEK